MTGTEANTVSVYMPTLIRFINSIDTPANRVLAYLISNVDQDCCIKGYIKVIAFKVEVSERTLTQVLHKLALSDMIKTKRNGVHMINPTLIRGHSFTRGAELVKDWKALD